MVKHFGAQRVQNALSHLWHKHELEIVAHEVQNSYKEESCAHPMKQGKIPLGDRPINAQLYQVGDADVGAGVESHR